MHRRPECDPQVADIEPLMCGAWGVSVLAGRIVRRAGIKVA